MAWLRAWVDTFGEFDIDISTKEVVDGAFHNWMEPAQMGIENTVMFYESLYANLAKRSAGTELNLGVASTLAELSRKGQLKMAVVTSSRCSVVEPLMQKLGVDKYFEVVLGEEDYSNPKPAPELVYMALEKLGCEDKSEAIIIGDSGSDVGAGKRAGIATGLFFPEANKEYYQVSELEQLGADYLIFDFGEVKSLVCG